MAIATRPEKQTVITATKSPATTERVWREIEKASFAVVGYVTPSGEARSSGVVYKTVGRRLYFAVAPESWKARHIAASKRVSVTVPVHRGGILALIAPIPPATISFHAAGIVHPAGSVRIDSLSKELEPLLPRERRDNAVLIELIPEGRFLTYGVGVSLTDMRKPELAEAVVPVAN
jgi:hypothetical protein